MSVDGWFFEMDARNTSQKIKDIKKIEIKTKKLVNGLIQGNYHSCFKGRGIEFSEVREYCLNDDARSIDWKVSARMNKPYVKEFIEERNLDVFIVYAASGSQDFGTENRHKRELALELIASIAFSANRNNDNVGLFIITDKVEKRVPLRKGRKHLLRILHDIFEFKGESKKTDLYESLTGISRAAKKKSLMFIISDFMDDNLENLGKPLKYLSMKHDVVAVNMGDPREMDIPDVGLIELEDEESGDQMLVDTSSEEFRRRYGELVNSRDKLLRDILKKCRIDIVDINTRDGWFKPILGFFGKRIKRRI